LKKCPNSLGKKAPFLGKGLSSLGKHMFQTFYNHNHYNFAFICCCDLSLERFQGEFQFCRWKYFNSKFICKSYDQKKNLNTFVPQGNLSSFSQMDMIVPRGNKSLSCFPRQLKGESMMRWLKSGVLESII